MKRLMVFYIDRFILYRQIYRHFIDRFMKIIRKFLKVSIS